MSSPVAVDFITSIEDLLYKSEGEDPNQTKVDVFQLPPTPDLNERFVMTFCGPEARVVASLCLRYMDNLATVASRRSAAPQ